MITNFPDVHFSTLRDELGLALGVDAEDGQITNQFARQCARALTAATRYAWQVYSWPEVCPVLTALEVDAGGGRMVPVVAPGYELLRVYSENPDTAFADTDEALRAKEIPFCIGRRGNIVLSESVTTPFYLVRLAPPVFGAEAWSATVDYQAGAVVFDAGGDNSAGDCYAAVKSNFNNALPTTWEPWRESAAIVSGDNYFVHGVLWEANDSGTVVDTMEPGVGSLWLSYFEPEHLAWAPQRLPRFLQEAVLAGAEAWLQRTMEGQVASMAVVRKVMDEHLGTEVASRWATRRQRRNGLPLHLS